MLYHVTSAAQEILARGFRDAITKRGPHGDYPAGVWLSNRLTLPYSAARISFAFICPRLARGMVS